MWSIPLCCYRPLLKELTTLAIFCIYLSVFTTYFVSSPSMIPKNKAKSFAGFCRFVSITKLAASYVGIIYSACVDTVERVTSNTESTFAHMPTIRNKVYHIRNLNNQFKFRFAVHMGTDEARINVGPFFINNRNSLGQHTRY